MLQLYLFVYLHIDEWIRLSVQFASSPVAELQEWATTPSISHSSQSTSEFTHKSVHPFSLWFSFSYPCSCFQFFLIGFCSLFFFFGSVVPFQLRHTHIPGWVSLWFLNTQAVWVSFVVFSPRPRQGGGISLHRVVTRQWTGLRILTPGQSWSGNLRRCCGLS